MGGGMAAPAWTAIVSEPPDEAGDSDMTGSGMDPMAASSNGVALGWARLIGFVLLYVAGALDIELTLVIAGENERRNSKKRDVRRKAESLGTEVDQSADDAKNLARKLEPRSHVPGGG